jgi:hypothetical protein
MYLAARADRRRAFSRPHSHKRVYRTRASLRPPGIDGRQLIAVPEHEERDAGGDRQTDVESGCALVPTFRTDGLVRPIQTLYKDVEQLSCGANQPTDRMT